MARRTFEQMQLDQATVVRIRAALGASTVAVERAMLLLYGLQTADERTAEMTVHTNGVGFSANDATVGTRIVKNVILKARAAGIPEGKRLWGSSLAISRRIALRYAGTQLLVATRAKQAAQLAARREEHDGEQAFPLPRTVAA